MCENGTNYQFFGPYFPTFGLNTEIYSEHFSRNEAI